MIFNYKLQPDETTARDTTQDLTMLAATWALFYGATLIVQDEKIWRYPAYDTAKLLPYSPASWGFILVLGGSLMFIGMFTGKHRVMRWGAGISCAWNFFFTFSLSREFLDDNISLSPSVTYLAFCIGYAIVCVTYRRKNALHKAPS